MLEIPVPTPDYIHVHALRSGLGSNPVGLDRSQLGRSRVVSFEVVGRRAFLVERNLKFRAVNAKTAERRAVDESFARSILQGFDVIARGKESIVLDATAFLTQDLHGVRAALKRSGQGAFKLDSKRSFPLANALRSFPKNTELEAELTFRAENPGGLVRGVAPTGDGFSVRQHQSFIALPEAGYQPRVAHPRCGFFTVSFLDFAAPLDKPMRRSWIRRHRLAPKQKLTYYVDRGAPEPLRTALVEGASWWRDAFADAGFSDAFEVKLLPEDADPLDVRFNVIQWVHRATRGWSYGSSVVDPRTGEILKGHVLLGSQRVRHDQVLYAGLGASRTGCAGCEAGAGAALIEAPFGSFLPPGKRLALALARIRQLAAHEVGHTLGLCHNFAASTKSRASVMDYPPPRVTLDKQGKPVLDDAYEIGVGAWDKLAIRYGYAQPRSGQKETAMLADVVNRGIADGLPFLTDADCRSPGSACPDGALWDDGEDAVQALRLALRVREVGAAPFRSRQPGRR